MPTNDSTPLKSGYTATKRARLKRALATNATNTSYQLTADAVLQPADTASLKRIPCDGALAAMIVFFGVGADNSQGLCTIWAEYGQLDSEGTQTGEVLRFPMGIATITLGANLGVGTSVTSSERLADGVSWAANAFLTAAENAFNEGTSGAASPADDSQGALFLPCLARCSALVLDFNVNGAATDPTSLNANVALFQI